MTPAQASGHPNFVTDVATQGPTDPGIRKADCWQVKNMIPARPACADCEGPIPMWAKQSFLHGVGEQVSFGGSGSLGFALGGTADVWLQLNREQQTWVMNALTKLNDLIVKATGTKCPTWGPAITAAGGCFQAWYNSNYLPMNPGAERLRTDGFFDEDTLCALIVTTALHPADFPIGFPDPEGRFCVAKKGLSKGAIIGIAAGGAAALAGIVYVATRKPRRRR